MKKVSRRGKGIYGKHKAVLLRLRPDVHAAAVKAARASGASTLSEWLRRLIAVGSGFTAPGPERLQP